MAAAICDPGWRRLHADLERRSRSRPAIGIRTTVVSGPRAPAGRATSPRSPSGPLRPPAPAATPGRPAGPDPPAAGPID